MSIAKNKCLMMALCVGLCAAAIGCSGEVEQQGGNGTLSVSSDNVSLMPNAKEQIIVSYLDENNNGISNANLNFKTSTASCASISKLTATTGDDGKASFEIEAVSKANCSATITVNATDNNAVAPKEISVTVSAASYALIASPGNLDLDANGNATIVATLTKDNAGAANETLEVKVDDPSCLNVANASLYTDTDGKANIAVTAGDHDCKTNIRIANNNTDTAVVVATVTAQEEEEVEGAKLTLLDPAYGTLNVDMNATDDIVVKYAAGATPVKNGKLTIIPEEGNCTVVNDGIKSVRTDNNGQAIIPVKAGSSTCMQNVTISNKDGSSSVSVKIVVGTPAEFTATIHHVADEASDNIQNTSYLKSAFYYDNTCDKLYANGVSVDALRPVSADEQWPSANSDAGDVKDWTKLPSAILDQINSDYDNVAVLTLGYNKDKSAALVHGCVDHISVHNQNATMTLYDFPTLLAGEYDIVTNLDLSSGFQKTANNTLMAENMAPGDWVQFAIDVTGNPLRTALEFVYDNTLSRIPEFDIKIAKINFAEYKNVVVSLADTSLNKLLEKYPWYKILTNISGDVEKLIGNMQLEGKLKVISEPDTDDLIALEQDHEYNYLRYRLKSYQCDTPDDPDACYHPMALNSDGLNGKWGGSIGSCSKDDASCKAVINFDSHKMTFKWATVIYKVVFQEILPKALGYSNDPNYPNELSGFLYFVAFDPLVNWFQSEHSDYTLQQSDSCGKLIEVLGYFILTGLSMDVSYANTIASVAHDAACEKGLGALDNLIKEKALGRFTLDFPFSSDNCPMTTGGTSQYTMIGAPDKDRISANDYFNPKNSTSKTNRCTWNIGVDVNGTPATIKGLFNATRVAE